MTEGGRLIVIPALAATWIDLSAAMIAERGRSSSGSRRRCVRGVSRLWRQSRTRASISTA